MFVHEAAAEGQGRLIGNPGRLGDLGVKFRAFDEEDRNYIISSYMQSYWKHGLREIGRTIVLRTRDDVEGVDDLLERMRHDRAMPAIFMDNEAYSVNQRAVLLGLLAAGDVIIAGS